MDKLDKMTTFTYSGQDMFNKLCFIHENGKRNILPNWQDDLLGWHILFFADNFLLDHQRFFVSRDGAANSAPPVPL